VSALNSHDHNCFVAAYETFLRLQMIQDGRTGFFLYIGDGDREDAHFLGNTAFAAGAFGRLARDVLATHTPGRCTHCDAVANALKDAKLAFDSAMEAHKNGVC
jgi:hypothetical protein